MQCTSGYASGVCTSEGCISRHCVRQCCSDKRWTPRQCHFQAARSRTRATGASRREAARTALSCWRSAAVRVHTAFGYFRRLEGGGAILDTVVEQCCRNLEVGTQCATSEAASTRTGYQRLATGGGWNHALALCTGRDSCARNACRRYNCTTPSVGAERLTLPKRAVLQSHGGEHVACHLEQLCSRRPAAPRIKRRPAQ